MVTSVEAQELEDDIVSIDASIGDLIGVNEVEAEAMARKT
jgi:hypothetical protein